MDGVRNGFDQIAQELCRDHFAGFPMQFDEGEFAGPVDCDEQSEFALGGLHLGKVNMEVADRITLELRPFRLLTLSLGQAGDTMSLQATMQG